MVRVFRQKAFTLIELLTVIAIITLLIGILTPSLSRARNEAKKAAVKAQLAAIGTGLEMFRNNEGKYPPSNAAELGGDTALAMTNWIVGDPTNKLQGANLLVDAMVGRDFLGYDPKPSDTITNYNRWDQDNSRREPFIDPSGISSSTENTPIEDAFGVLPVEATPMLNYAGGQIYSPVFLDKFERPILYYRANPNATQRTNILASSYTGNLPDAPGVYNGRDNEVFTDHALGTAPGQHHEIHEASIPLPDADKANPAANNFADFIRSFRSSSLNPSLPLSQQRMRPVNSRKFILLTPGKDGIFGNLDDVGNFAVKSEER